MLVQPIPVSPWQANCYVVSASEDVSECVIVDPGITADEPVGALIRERGLSPMAILATHGHLDHVGDAHLLAARWRVPVYLSTADQHLLTRPADGLGPSGAAMLRQLTGSETLPAIDDVRDYGEPFTVAGLTVEAFAAPGHTKGSTLLRVSSSRTTVVFSGDVLFAGTIGRTDLPGGNMAEMRDSLRRIVEHFPAQTPLLPGHGQPTSLAQELASNPYLQPGNV
ncbi:MBL fold metallo-hydrolase [Tessaracoccus sp. MC1865]|uniref:MBL fold metallo-hydrolase n=1 Tax=unclassified Tessaracoccus TaxID=2635419 RepID=UPI001C726512|nr:MBL fold metallo-hydrolase [Tessaracoccus sp. MC1865]